MASATSLVETHFLHILTVKNPCYPGILTECQVKDDPPCKVGSSNYSVMVSKPQKAIWHGPGLQRGKVDVYDFYQVQELAQVVTAA